MSGVKTGVLKLLGLGRFFKLRVKADFATSWGGRSFVSSVVRRNVSRHYSKSLTV